MEELKRFQGSTFDTIARRNIIEDRDTILEPTGKIQELQRWNQLHKRFEGFSRCWISTQWTIPRGQSTSVFLTLSISWWNAKPFCGNAEPQDWADTHGFSGNVFTLPSTTLSHVVDASEKECWLWQYTQAARRKPHHGCFVPAKFTHSTFTSGKMSVRAVVVISLLVNNAAPLPVTTTLSSNRRKVQSSTRPTSCQMETPSRPMKLVPAKFFFCMQVDRAEPQTLITFSGCCAVRPRS